MRRVERSYAKWVRDEDGEIVGRYRAIDDADTALVCDCGEATCVRGRLLPLREHIAELHRAVVDIGGEEIASWEPSRWSSMLYALRMAASIEDVEADTGYVQSAMAFAMCEPAIDYELGQSEMASKYVAAATIFNFIWQAYEAVVSETAPAELRRLARERRNGERGRRLLETRPSLTSEFAGIDTVVANALYQCRRGGRMDERCDAVAARFGTSGLVAAAELAREFRNFVFHGGDEAPAHSDWSEESDGGSQPRILRFYSVSRLLLYLIQAMAWIMYEKDARRFEIAPYDEQMTPCQILARLQFR